MDYFVHKSLGWYILIFVMSLAIILDGYLSPLAWFSLLTWVIGRIYLNWPGEYTERILLGTKSV